MSRHKIEAEEKIRIAKACAGGKLGLSEAARQIGVDRTAVRNWVRQYQEEGASAFLPRGSNRKYSPERKEAAVKAYLGGEGSLRDNTLPTTGRVRNFHPLDSAHAGRTMAAAVPRSRDGCNFAYSIVIA